MNFVEQELPCGAAGSLEEKGELVARRLRAFAGRFFTTRARGVRTRYKATRGNVAAGGDIKGALFACAGEITLIPVKLPALEAFIFPKAQGGAVGSWRKDATQPQALLAVGGSLQIVNAASAREL